MVKGSLETFFTGHRLARPTGHAEQLPAGRGQRRIAAAPDTLRPAVAGFADLMLHLRHEPEGARSG
jgi:hypothetical protein